MPFCHYAENRYSCEKGRHANGITSEPIKKGSTNMKTKFFLLTHTHENSVNLLRCAIDELARIRKEDPWETLHAIDTAVTFSEDVLREPRLRR